MTNKPLLERLIGIEHMRALLVEHPEYYRDICDLPMALLRCREEINRIEKELGIQQKEDGHDGIQKG